MDFTGKFIKRSIEKELKDKKFTPDEIDELSNWASENLLVICRDPGAIKRKIKEIIGRRKNVN